MEDIYEIVILIPARLLLKHSPFVKFGPLSFGGFAGADDATICEELTGINRYDLVDGACQRIVDERINNFAISAAAAFYFYSLYSLLTILSSSFLRRCCPRRKPTFFEIAN